MKTNRIRYIVRSFKSVRRWCIVRWTDQVCV